MDEFRIGSVLHMSARALARNFIAVFLTSAAFFVPILAYKLNWIDGRMAESSQVLLKPNNLNLPLLFTLVSAFGTCFVASTLTYGVVMDMQGRRIGAGEWISKGFARSFTVVGVAFVSGLSIAGGLLLLIIPGVIVACMLYVAIPAVVIERTGIMGALGRSRELTRGHKSELFVMLLIIGGLRVANVLFMAFAIRVETVANLKVFTCFEVGSEALFAALTSVIAAVTYCALRAEKDGQVLPDDSIDDHVLQGF